MEDTPTEMYQSLQRIPCKFPGCRCWFGNKAGLMQHTIRFHPSFLTNPSTSGLTSTCFNTTAAGQDEDEASNGDVSPHAGAGAEGDVLDSHWHGSGAKLYCNYHPKLTGSLCMLLLLITMF